MNENKIQLSTFPGTASEALAILYVQNQDLTGKEPAEIFNLYNDALEEIRQNH